MLYSRSDVIVVSMGNVKNNTHVLLLFSGVFWINWESAMQFFDVVYMNWNPKLFKYRYALHS